MPKEARYIMFDTEECRRIIENALRHLGNARPGAITRMRFGMKDGAVGGIATVRYGQHLEDLPLTAFDIMKGTLVLCSQNRIPIPMRANKTLEVVNGCLALVARINLTAKDYIPAVNGDAQPMEAERIAA